MPTREQVRQLAESGLGYEEIGRRLGIPPGLAHLIGTGLPADGGTAPEEREARGLPPTSRQWANPPHGNPVAKETVRQWIAERVRADAQMRRAKQD
ncbi:hypothetical protein [Amycolatopsis sp.]|uniref:hypothetical protein n=1 Tax=Amycolatopsis sp. TaxID=37632 RepID=UPI002B778CC4|nr:hypothetical protein [Amycolatopsis sp.]HVV12587.1 hypothetical protein [Amycolatopsis sp.]